jgi:iron-sulfur cluster assembly accessory protein
MTIAHSPTSTQASPVASGVSITAAAAQRITEITAAETNPTCLRISVEGGGCSGFQYKFALTATPAADDLIVERDGARVLIDPVSLEYMAGSQVDFVDNLMGASFKVSNPQATAGCGCGTSFAL